MDDTGPQRSPKKLLRLLITLLGLATFLLAILWVGQWTRERITVAFADIECDPPSNQSRAEFLAEVQYLASLPDHLQLHDDNLPSRLAGAFALHPQVEKVQEVKIVPPRRIQVRLIFRTPSRTKKE
jgi:hypothetical protein